jgi:Tfp pilus assembly protein PilF
LNGYAWDVVKAGGAGKDAYALALRRAEAAVRRAPDNGSFLNTLGVAQYRTGRYAEALQTLRKSEKLNTPTIGLQPADLAFLAMALYQLGKKDEAKSPLSRLRELMRQPRWANDAEAQSLLREAEEALQAKPVNPRP